MMCSRRLMRIRRGEVDVWTCRGAGYRDLILEYGL